MMWAQEGDLGLQPELTTGQTLTTQIQHLTGVALLLETSTTSPGSTTKLLKTLTQRPPMESLKTSTLNSLELIIPALLTAR